MCRIFFRAFLSFSFKRPISPEEGGEAGMGVGACNQTARSAGPPFWFAVKCRTSLVQFSDASGFPIHIVAVTGVNLVLGWRKGNALRQGCSCITSSPTVCRIFSHQNGKCCEKPAFSNQILCLKSQCLVLFSLPHFFLGMESNFDPPPPRS